jgi:hypothetical protein
VRQYTVRPTRAWKEIKEARHVQWTCTGEGM